MKKHNKVINYGINTNSELSHKQKNPNPQKNKSLRSTSISIIYKKISTFEVVILIEVSYQIESHLRYRASITLAR